MAAVMPAPMAAPVDLLDRGLSGNSVGELAEGDARGRGSLRAAGGDEAGESARSDGKGNHFRHYGSFHFSVRYQSRTREDTAHIRILPA